MSIIVNVSEHEDFPVVVEIGIEFGQFQSRMVLYEPHLCSKADWLKLAQAVLEKEVEMLSFSDRSRSIICDGKVLRCTALPSSDDMMLEIILPLDAQTYQALMEVIEHPLMNACWTKSKDR